MSEIISKDLIRAKARAAFHANHSRDSHGFNWHAPALVTWLEEYDRLSAIADGGHLELVKQTIRNSFPHAMEQAA